MFLNQSIRAYDARFVVQIDSKIYVRQYVLERTLLMEFIDKFQYIYCLTIVFAVLCV